jgi:quinol-cytochrome oxidoreductase complex cytochrome b subunit
MSARVLRFTHTFALGSIALVLIVMLVASGLLMIFIYEPAPDRAYQSIMFMQRELLFGHLIRNLHYWSANILIAVLALHVLRVFLTGGFHGPRQSNWLIGLGLLVSLLLSAFTGYLLPWDQISYWAITICTGMLAYIPGIGEIVQQIVLGGQTIGPATLINFYVAHTTVIPLLLIALILGHFWRIRLAGGVVAPRDAGNGTQSRDGFRPVDPDLLSREVSVALIAIACALLAAVFFDAPLGEPANPGLSPNPAKAPWYFLGFQELLLHFHPLFAVVVLPVLTGAGMVLIPFLHYDADLSGNWFLSARGKHMAMVAVIAAALGTPLWVLADEILVGPEGWLPGTSLVVSRGFVPFSVMIAGIAGFYLVMRKKFSASINESVQAVFILVGVAFTVLTITGIWFRGPGMTLVWPWQM